MNAPRYATLIDEHEKWLARWPGHLDAWRQRSNTDVEGAIAEAWVQHELSKQVEVEPYEVPGQGGVDFLCRTHKSELFAVEVANLDADAVGTRTDLPAKMDDWEGGSPGNIASKLMGVRRRKSKQLASTSGPVLLAITCLHETAAFTHFCESGARDLLIPPTERVITFPTEPNPDFVTETWEQPVFTHSFFFKPGSQARTYMDACPEISGVLLCAVPWVEADSRQPVMTLVLNPLPLCPFDRSWLPEVRCMELAPNWSTTDPCDWDISMSPGVAPDDDSDA